MCGIFGFVNNNKEINNKKSKKMADLLFKLSELRGQDASGLAFLSREKAFIYKKSEKASKFVKTTIYKNLFQQKIGNIAFLGHDRLATNGDLNINNQPIVKGDVFGVHNGIIVNDNELWQKFGDLKREYDTDTEILFALMSKFVKKYNNLILATQKTYQEIYGYASMALFFKKYNCLLLATNNGSLYFAHSGENKIFVFASEYLILKKFIQKIKLDFLKIHHLKSNSGLLLNLSNLDQYNFSFSGSVDVDRSCGRRKNIEIIDLSDYGKLKTPHINIANFNMLDNENKYLNRKEKWKNLKRCTKCILPETMPFIEFDDEGVCNYCRNHQKIKFLGKDRLKKDILNYRKPSGVDYDSMLMFSGGRDSCYALHFLKKELNLNPVAYSYDWGMLTDLGRRNQSRMCSALGVEHIIISADIAKKRKNIKKNVLAWLKKPHLGMIPLFMAGDKQFFYYANQLKKKMNIDLVFQGSNPYEKTDFKYGFSGVKTKIRVDKNRKVSIGNRLALPTFYLRQFIQNPAYLNSSLFDTVFAYSSYYLSPRNYFGLFRYVKWDEKEVDDILVNNYGWELADDTPTTWRIGDGTAAFYNYIYYMVAGFTENDTFRSNQIREGLMSREEALRKVEKENYPRYKSIKWYCDILGLDYKRVMQKINFISPLL